MSLQNEIGLLNGHSGGHVVDVWLDLAKRLANRTLAWRAAAARSANGHPVCSDRTSRTLCYSVRCSRLIASAVSWFKYRPVRAINLLVDAGKGWGVLRTGI